MGLFDEPIEDEDKSFWGPARKGSILSALEEHQSLTPKQKLALEREKTKQARESIKVNKQISELRKERLELKKKEIKQKIDSTKKALTSLLQ